MNKIVIKKDCIQFGDTTLCPPFEKEAIDALFGTHEEKRLENEKFVRMVSVWDTHGIVGYLSNDLKEYETLQIRLSSKDYINSLIQGVYTGSIYIDKKEYSQCTWKEDMPFAHILKKGCFELSTFLIDQIDEVPEKYKETAIQISRSFEITYIKPKKKHKNSFVYPKVTEELLSVSDLNFKLAIMQVLMYEKEILQPKFDLYQFAEEYTKRKIDIEEEGYEPIKEALNWFKKYPISKDAVKEIEAIHMDGGDEIYHQICPFWDGEDTIFDIKKITKEDLVPFENLKELTLMTTHMKKIQKELSDTNIKIEEL